MQSDMGVLDDFEFSLPDEDFKALYFLMANPNPNPNPNLNPNPNPNP